MNQTQELRVLVADDDPSLRELLSLGLRAEGADVRVAEDGNGAIDAAAEWLPDLLVLDVMMPEVDGLTVLETLRSSESTADIPVVLLSARATDDEIWEGWKAGADYYITKPFKLADLLEFLRMLESSHPRRSALGV